MGYTLALPGQKYQLACRQVAILQGQVVLHGSNSARIVFLTLSIAISSSYSERFSLILR